MVVLPGFFKIYIMLSKHFTVEEFVPKAIFDQYGASSKWFIDPKIVAIAEFIREEFELPVTINNWHTGGKFQERGYRVPTTPTGARYSQHRFGRAIDFNVKGIPSPEVGEWVKASFAHLKTLGLTTMENPTATPTWTHLDVRWTANDDLLIVNP